jgi:Radial spoke protein 3
MKEAELMETQRMEGARKRRIEETERRNLQQRTAKNQRVWAERKILARIVSKDFLLLFKRDNLQIL